MKRTCLDSDLSLNAEGKLLVCKFLGKSKNLSEIVFVTKLVAVYLGSLWHQSNLFNISFYSKSFNQNFLQFSRISNTKWKQMENMNWKVVPRKRLPLVSRYLRFAKSFSLLFIMKSLILTLLISLRSHGKPVIDKSSKSNYFNKWNCNWKLCGYCRLSFGK